MVIADIVAMEAARSRFENGRRVTIRDAERFQIGKYGLKIFKAKILVELNSVRTDRNAPAHGQPGQNGFDVKRLQGSSRHGPVLLPNRWSALSKSQIRAAKS